MNPPGMMMLYGFTSTSKDRSEAEKFTYCNPAMGLKRVLFDIHWNDSKQHYYIEGAFPHENEILLFDGTRFNVLSVQDEEYEELELYNVDHDGRYGP